MADSSSAFLERKSSSKKMRQTSQTDHGENNYDGDGGSEDGYVEEPDFSDPPDFVDRVTDEELLADLLRSKPKETDGTDSVIIVDNVPEVKLRLSILSLITGI